MDAVTIIECPPIVVVGMVGYVETPSGLRTLTTVWGHVGNEFKRRLYKNWYSSKKKAFTRHAKHAATDEGKADMERELERIRKYCQVVRVIAHSQVKDLPLRQKKAHVMEIQVNGGTVEEKVAFGLKLMEQPVRVSDLFSVNEMIDVIGITKGKGFEGVTARWGTTRLPRKSRKGLRKVGCIGPWHPAHVSYAVARAGQRGYHHRTEINKKVYRMGNGSDAKGATTDFDLTEKSINPMGGFPRYGIVKSDYLMVLGGVMGPKKRMITLRKSMLTQTSRRALEEIDLKFIDTSSKFGHGRFQTAGEKLKFMGPLKASAFAAQE